MVTNYSWRYVVKQQKFRLIRMMIPTAYEFQLPAMLKIQIVYKRQLNKGASLYCTPQFHSQFYSIINFHSTQSIKITTNCVSVLFVL